MRLTLEREHEIDRELAILDSWFCSDHIKKIVIDMRNLIDALRAEREIDWREFAHASKEDRSQKFIMDMEQLTKERDDLKCEVRGLQASIKAVLDHNEKVLNVWPSESKIPGIEFENDDHGISDSVGLITDIDVLMADSERAWGLNIARDQLKSENESLRSDLVAKSGEIGRAEHRGEIAAENHKLKDEMDHRDAIHRKEMMEQIRGNQKLRERINLLEGKLNGT